MFQIETFVNDKMKRDKTQRPWTHGGDEFFRVALMKPTSEARDEYILRTREARLKAGKKQEEVAAAIGVDRPTYTNYEKRRPMPQKYIAKFCAFTGVDSGWLLTGNGEMGGGSGIAPDLMERLRQLNEKQQEAFGAMLDSLIKKGE